MIIITESAKFQSVQLAFSLVFGLNICLYSKWNWMEQRLDFLIKNIFTYFQKLLKIVRF